MKINDKMSFDFINLITASGTGGENRDRHRRFSREKSCDIRSRVNESWAHDEKQIAARQKEIERDLYLSLRETLQKSLSIKVDFYRARRRKKLSLHDENNFAVFVQKSVNEKFN